MQKASVPSTSKQHVTQTCLPIASTMFAAEVMKQLPKIPRHSSPCNETLHASRIAEFWPCGWAFADVKKRDVMRVLKKPAAQLSCQSLIAMIATAVYSDMTCQIWKHGHIFLNSSRCLMQETPKKQFIGLCSFLVRLKPGFVLIESTQCSGCKKLRRWGRKPQSQANNSWYENGFGFPPVLFRMQDSGIHGPLCI